MAHIGSINGINVYSDKQVAAVIGTRITFTDGSWCDTHTGAIHNTGPGYINIGGTDTSSDAKEVTEGPKQVNASALKVSGIDADVHVDTHRGSGIEYTITGPADRVKAIRANVHSRTLVIESDGFGSSSDDMSIVSGGGRTVIHTGSGRTVVSGGSVVVGGNSIMSSIFGRGQGGVTTVITGRSGGENAVKVTVKVPQGAPVTADQVRGNVVIGDTCGPLTASVQGDSVSAGRITSARLTVQGSGDIRIKEVSGTVMAQVQGSGNVEIDRGSMPSLTATVQGSGDITIGGSATTASLTVMGSGDIRVAHVQQPPMKSTMGSGDIRVRRVG